jgi:hypothetical protein
VRKHLKHVLLGTFSFAIALLVIFLTNLERNKKTSQNHNNTSNKTNTTNKQLAFIFGKNNNNAQTTNSLDLCRLTSSNEAVHLYLIVCISLALTLFIYIWHALKSSSCKLKFNNIIRSPIMDPFSKRNRFITAVVYAAYTYHLLKIFNDLLVSDKVELVEKSVGAMNFSNFSNLIKPSSLLASEKSIMIELFKQICHVFIIGFRYYPVLMCVEMKPKSLICYFFCTLYIVFLLFSYVYNNMFCLSRLAPDQNVIRNAQNVITKKLSTFSCEEENFADVSKNSFMFENFFFYVVLFLTAFYMIFEFFSLIAKKFASKRCLKNRDEDVDELEIAYVKALLASSKQVKPISLAKYLIEKYIYKSHRHFRFPKQFINTQIIGFVLLYFVTFFLVRHTQSIVKWSGRLFIFVINFVFADSARLLSMSKSERNALINAACSFHASIRDNILLAAFFTMVVYAFQMFLGIKNFHRHVLNAYKGVYAGIPSPKKFTNAQLASYSLHYR